MKWNIGRRFGKQRLLAEGIQTTGEITAVRTVWWLTVNRSPVRRDNRNSAHPHVIRFRYFAGEAEFCGVCRLPWTVAPPAVGGTISVYYAMENPVRYAVKF